MDETRKIAESIRRRAIAGEPIEQIDIEFLIRDHWRNALKTYLSIIETSINERDLQERSAYFQRSYGLPFINPKIKQ